MSRKQKIYTEMLYLALPYIRNIQSVSFIRKGLDRSSYFEAELVHNLSVSILEEDIVDHDIWFLNQQARYYFNNAKPSGTPNYEAQCHSISELFSLVPEHLSNKLEWSGPKS